MDPQLTRRALLAAATGAGVLGALSACGHSTPRTAGTSPPAGSSAAPPSAVATGPPTATDWASFAGQLTGTLSRPGDSDYTAAYTLFNRRFDTIVPAGVVAVRSTSDIAACLRFSTAHDLPLCVRAGGHSYLGGSVGTGLVIDLRAMDTITVDAAAGTATIGTGAALIDVYAQLAAEGVSIPGGSCPAVGVSGLALGGGMGVVARQYGLTCDRLVAADVVLADGTATTVSASTDADLFWALRGGGGSFAIATALTFTTHPTESLATFYYTWPWSAAAAVMNAWQHTLPTAPDALWSTCHLLATADKSGPPTVTVAGVYVGASTAVAGLLAPFLNNVGSAPTVASIHDSSYLDVMLLEAGCTDSTVAACHVAGQSPAGTLPRDAFVAASDFFSAPIPLTELTALTEAIAARQATAGLAVGGVGFDTWGGAVNTVAADATAFVHRGALFAAQYTASWQDQPGDGPQPANQTSLNAIRATVRSAANGECYQNYADPTLSDPLTAYYGANLVRLQQVKARYDPTNRLAPPQGILPA